MASMDLIKLGEDSRRNWVTINELVRRVQKLEADVRRLGGGVEDGRRRQDIKGGVGGASNQFKGEYNPLIVYEVGESVKISAGITAGYYIKTASSVAGKNPSEGEVWAKLGNVIDEENWL